MIIETMEGLGYSVTGINGAMSLGQRIAARTLCGRCTVFGFYGCWWRGY